jgi:hypothetical protein
VLIDSERSDVSPWTRKGLAFTRLPIEFLVSFDAPMACTTLVCFAVEEEVAENATWTPEKPIGPALDTTLILIKNEN